MSELSKIINPIEGFQYSVNIAYDINDEKKIKSYIPSMGSLQIIEDILASTDNKSTDRARILTGAYGKGKSHLILYILAMLSGQNSSLFSTVIQKAAKENPTLEKNIRSYFTSGKKLLPVIVNATSLNIEATFLQSLDSALNRAGLSSIMPETFFDAAVEKILLWKKQYPNTYRDFEKRTGRNGEVFIDHLKKYDHGCYELFVRIYPLLTSGSEFNPLVGSDIIAIYESVIREISHFGYNGIFVVYDEFGKFLEGSVDKSSAMDIKLIQDFAEKCNRSSVNQLHILLISHKSIDNYIGRLPKTKVDAWKAVSNRFKAISISNDESEIYDMVATVLDRDEERYKRFVNLHQNRFDVLERLVSKESSFQAIKTPRLESIVYRCYPLHPYTLLLLPRISELVAQNERTIFTFLSSTERYSVPYFLRTDESEFPIIEPDYVYDYFEKLFKGEPYGSSIKKQWQITTAALAKLKEYDNTLAEKIVKTIALIYCVNDFEIIPPSWDLICDIYSVNFSWAEIEAAKQTLKKSHLLIELMYKPYVRISEGSRYDVLELIQQEIYKIENIIKTSDVFNSYHSVKYLYPVQYNDEHEIVRYFDFKFVDVDEMSTIMPNGLSLETDADGVVYAILVQSDNELLRATELASNIHNHRAVFIVPKTYFDCKSIAASYQANVNLKNAYAGKELELLEELDYILEDRQNVLDAYISNTFFRYDKGGSAVYYDGVEQSISRKAQLSQLLSNIMSQIYSKTPKIVNDLINKNQISSTIRSARNKILSALLSGSYKKNLGLAGNGPEVNILRSTLIIPGVFIGDDEDAHLELDCADKDVKAVLSVIKKHIVQSTQSQNHTFAELYDILTSPEYGYGLKKGVIPIYLAVVLAFYKAHIVILHRDRELPLSANVLCDIDYCPGDYSIVLEAWDEKKEIYIANLEDVFSDFVSASDKSNGSFVYIVKAMRRWFLQLPKYAVVTKQVYSEDGEICPLDKASIRFRNALNSPELNAHEFLFERLPKIYESEDYDALIKSLRHSFRCINDAYNNIHIKLINDLKGVLGNSKPDSLPSLMENFYDDLKTTTKEHSFSGKVSMFLDVAKHPNNDEYKLVELIARAIFNLRMSDFTDEIMNCYISEVDAVIKEIRKYDEQLANSGKPQGGYKIIFTDENGQEVTKQFDMAEYTESGQILYNDITTILDEYGGAVSSDEKRQILFRILKELV